MARLDNPTYIHHDELDVESVVDACSVTGWQASGWEAGPLPRLQADRDAADAERLADIRQHAEDTAAEQARAAAAVDGSPEAIAVEQPVDIAPVDTPESEPALPAPTIADRPRGSREPVPAGDTTPNTPQEG